MTPALIIIQTIPHILSVTGDTSVGNRTETKSVLFPFKVLLRHFEKQVFKTKLKKYLRIIKHIISNVNCLFGGGLNVSQIYDKV